MKTSFLKVKLIYQILISQRENFKRNNIFLNEEDYSFVSRSLVESKYTTRFNGNSTVYKNGIQLFIVHKYTGTLKPLTIITHTDNHNAEEYILSTFIFLFKLNILTLQKIKIHFKNEGKD